MPDNIEPTKMEKSPCVFDDYTEAMLEAAAAQGYRVGAVMLLRPSRSGEIYEFCFLTNTGAGPDVAAAAARALEASGFPKGMRSWAKEQ